MASRQRQNPSKAYLASLKAIEMRANTKAVLPLELMAIVLDYLPIPDLMHCAQTSRKMQEMVYEDSRWIQKLRLMGIWDEEQARRRFEEKMHENLDNTKTTDRRFINGTGKLAINGHESKETLFDAILEDRGSIPRPPRFFEDKGRTKTLPLTDFNHVLRQTPLDALRIFETVVSVRERAREEFGKVYAALAPLYTNVANSSTLSEAELFRLYEDPEEHAKILNNLQTFARCDVTQGSASRIASLESIEHAFERAAIRDFDEGYAARDYDGRMRRYAHVLITLHKGAAALDIFIRENPLLKQKDRFGNPLACLEGATSKHVNLSASQSFFHAISRALDEQVAIIDRVFPSTVDVMIPLMSRIVNSVISEYIVSLFNEARKKSIDAYVKIVPGVFEQSLRFVKSLYPAVGSEHCFQARATQIMTKCFEPHVDLYLGEELDYLKSKSILEVETWEKQLSAHEASTDSFFMSSVNRQAAKRDFLASFKSVLMMPVNVLPGISSGKRPVSDTLTNSTTSTPSMAPVGVFELPSTPRTDLPKTELAAKAEIMNSRLEGIGSLFSIEVALSLVHLAKSSIERAAILIQVGGHRGVEAKEQGQAIFIYLLEILGHRHVRSGFDKAVHHLSNYKARDVLEHTSSGVKPLVTFLELVNVGDLIQQMVDVFYGQQLVSKGLTDRDDFLDPAVKAKKKFEQMLDERVAAGLNKGIDVLMDEVEFLCATTQIPSDFCPSTWSDKTQGSTSTVLDIGPTKTAIQVVDLVSSHTGMLVGSTDKNMLEVFNQEVGLRLFAALCKHLKRQRINTQGAIILISDTNHYFAFIASFKNKELLLYFKALRELSQIFLIDGRDAKELAAIIADAGRYHGIFRVEEVLKFAERRADWYQIRAYVEKALYGIGCCVI